MTVFGDEPDLALGDSGDTVTQLQTRLQAIGLFDGAIDGAFGESTEHAVSALHLQAGIAADGKVGAATWQALVQAEQSAGVTNPFQAAVVAAGDAAAAATPVGTLSEDHHWRWDGEHWQANEEEDGPLPPADSDGGGRLSADGQWLWDGNQWQPVR